MRELSCGVGAASSLGGVRRRVLYGAFALAVVTYLDRVCISAAAPFIMRDLGLSVLQMSVVFSAFTLAYSLFEVPSGWMADVFGPRRVLTRIVLWWSGFTVLTASAWSYGSLVAIRFLFGAGEAGAFPGVARAFARWFPAHERGRANGILFLGSRVGGALAPALAMILIRAWGWRASFVAFGILGVFWAVAWYRWYRDDPADHPEVSPAELDWIRQAESPGVAGTVESATADTRGPAAVPWRAIVRNPTVYAICAMYFAFGYGLYFYFTWLPTYLTQVLGFSTIAGGLFAGLPFVLAGAADIAGGYLTDRLGARFGLRVGRCWLGAAAFSTCGVMLVLSVQLDSRIAKALLLAFALASADLGLSACWAVCLDVGKDFAGVVTGLMNTFGNLGGVIGPLVVGVAVERWASWAIPFYITAAVYGAGAVSWLLIDPSRRISPAPPR
jgi:MFS family permease